MAIRVLTLEGTPEQMGSAHGESLRDEIHDCLERWVDHLATVYGTSPHELIRAFLNETSLVRISERLTPDLHAELAAIARAADVDQGLLWAWNHLDEFWWFAGIRLEGARAPEVSACSCVGIASAPSGAPIVAQNMDLSAFMTWDPFLLRLRPTGAPQALVLVNPGVLAQCGCNANGIAVCVNELMALRPSDEGVPVTFMIRRILAQPDLASVRSLLHATPHASGQNYLVGSPDGLLDFECSAGRVAELGEGAPLVLHTNHPLVNDDRRVVEKRQNSFDRLAFLEAALDPDSDRHDVQAALSDRTTPVCKTGEQGRTYASVVMELTDPPNVWVSPGPPSQDAYEPVPFSPDR